MVLRQCFTSANVLRQKSRGETDSARAWVGFSLLNSNIIYVLLDGWIFDAFYYVPWMYTLFDTCAVSFSTCCLRSIPNFENFVFASRPSHSWKEFHTLNLDVIDHHLVGTPCNMDELECRPKSLTMRSSNKFGIALAAFWIMSKR